MGRGVSGSDRSAIIDLIDRRSFIAKAGLLVAGSALESTLIGCSDYQVQIPCLGPAAAPAPVEGMTYLWASKIGCALDCDLRSGRNKYTGGHATDDAPRINAAMAAASADHPITLIIDGSALISGLFPPAGGYWGIAGLGCGTGFFVKSGTNNDGIHNGPREANVPVDPGPPAPRRGMNVSLQNFTLNGNQGNGRSGDSTAGQPRGSKTTWIFGINLMNLDNITIEKVVVVNAPSYHIRLSNVGNVVVSGCVLHSQGYNTDGLHFDGPSNDITISNCDFQTDDDSIALNCPEGYTGNISRVSVTNCTFRGWSLMRLYTAGGLPGQFRIDSVNVSNCSGTLSEFAFAVGLNGASLPDSVDSLTVSDCTLTAPAVVGVAENFGSITLRNITFIPTLSNVQWTEPQSSHVSAILRPSPINGRIDYLGSNLTLEGCVIQRDSDTKVAAIVVESNTTIANLVFNGLTVNDTEPRPPVPALLEVGEGTISQLVLNSLNSTHITVPVSSRQFASIGAVSGSGVLATGWEFPDFVMANRVPYISAKTGRPSIKIDGIVEPYPQ